MTTPARRRSLLYVSSVCCIVVLLAAIAVPNYVKARFDSSGEPLAVRVHVRDHDSGKPIHGASVCVPGSRDAGATDEGGRCQLIEHFRMTGTAGAGEYHLRGNLRVSAPGYRTWEQPLKGLFGDRWDREAKGTAAVARVYLMR